MKRWENKSKGNGDRSGSLSRNLFFTFYYGEEAKPTAEGGSLSSQELCDDWWIFFLFVWGHLTHCITVHLNSSKCYLPQDVALLDYRAPSLATECIASHVQGDKGSAKVLDVACGTGLVSVKVNK